MGLCSNLAISCISVTSSKNGDDDDSDKDNVNDNRLLDLHVMLTNNCMENWYSCQKGLGVIIILFL